MSGVREAIMGMIIDTPEALRLGIEARRETWTLIANAFADDNKDHMCLSASGSEGSAADSVSLELGFDQIRPLIEGLESLWSYLKENGRV